MVPYMKGFHLMLDGWREGRNSEVWKYGKYVDLMEPPKALKQVKAKPVLTRVSVRNRLRDN
jgi:hypothetical protein